MMKEEEAWRKTARLYNPNALSPAELRSCGVTLVDLNRGLFSAAQKKARQEPGFYICRSGDLIKVDGSGASHPVGALSHGKKSGFYPRACIRPEKLGEELFQARQDVLAMRRR